MFWSDPTLYGYNFKDVQTPVQTPFVGPAYTPWQNIPRFIPPTYGLTLPYYNVNLPNVPMFNPYLHTQTMHPFSQPFNVAQPYNIMTPQIPQIPQMIQPFRPFPF